ncbi:anthranilate synthase component I family protein [Hymenobacter actinosclerus]|uniref:Para-aminobenzoate synthetase component 1 n=1 Tax=Hymenobacter actinosclerus TaxID=82805 RepID=A0A1I0DM71_9BACT|nr:anthranilate synthase component I family protein [Hymenobacter actinosclerus]SET33222.1 para-aminobenzoate synthetase component 1 [Hymenobacter actinosclerus]
MLTVPLTQLPPDFRARALRWASGFAYCAYYEPNDLIYPSGPFRRVLAVAAAAPDAPRNLGELEAWLADGAGSVAPACGFIGYEVKDELEALISTNPSDLAWPILHFFRPQTWLIWEAEALHLHGETAGVLAAIAATPLPPVPPPAVAAVRPRMPKADYLRAVEAVREDILNGEVYELNLCQEFTADAGQLDPVDLFERLNAASPAPFAGFLRHESHYLLCASPERFVRRTDAALLSQPIKGTIARGATAEQDEIQRQTLLQDEKERAENLMIVDLVRNDLARVAQTGTVQVPELFGLYPFRHVWQMISSITARLQPGLGVAAVLRATFPMGSMTGAPKIRAMQLIEHYEHRRRGLYSGSLGLIWPSGDFDFNVVIRSLQYRSDTGHLSFQVGSAITYDSVPEREYAECLLKARAILEVLGAEVR